MLGQTHYRRQSAGGPGQINTKATSWRQHDGVRRAPEPIRSGRGGAGFGWGGARTPSRVAEGEVREDLPDDRGIVQGGDQAQPTSTMDTSKDINGKRSAGVRVWVLMS